MLLRGKVPNWLNPSQSDDRLYGSAYGIELDDNEGVGTGDYGFSYDEGESGDGDGDCSAYGYQSISGQGHGFGEIDTRDCEEIDPLISLALQVAL